jgi:hypothetical protein
MARLDNSLHGRSFEKFGRITIRNGQLKFFNLDSGYAAYVSYLHMEVAYTNPIMLGEFIKIKT